MAFPSYRAIDLETWPRREHFAYYRDALHVGYSLTCQIDVSPLLDFAHKHRLRFYGCLIYAVSRTVNAMDEMIRKYLAGAEVVYGVRSRRDTDTFFKRFTAEGFYHLMNLLGADIVFNHADYRLISSRVLDSFADYREVNIFLRGMVPLVGFASDTVAYERHERLAGESHYPLSKMLALAFDGITSLSNKPIRLITGIGMLFSILSFIGVVWAFIGALMGSTVAGWASTVCIVCLMGGIQLVCLGVIGEYIGKIYMETKARPRYIISERTWAPYERKYHG